MTIYYQFLQKPLLWPKSRGFWRNFFTNPYFDQKEIDQMMLTEIDVRNKNEFNWNFLQIFLVFLPDKEIAKVHYAISFKEVCTMYKIIVLPYCFMLAWTVFPRLNCIYFSGRATFLQQKEVANLVGKKKNRACHDVNTALKVVPGGCERLCRSAEWELLGCCCCCWPDALYTFSTPSAFPLT